MYATPLIFRGYDNTCDAGRGPQVLAAICGGGLPPSSNLRDIPGLIYRNRDSVATNAPCHDADLDTLPAFDWSLENPARFTHASRTDQPSSLALVCESRGCSARCGHCMAWMINGGAARNRSTAGLCAEIEQLVHACGAHTFEFNNSLLSSADIVSELCEWILSNGLRISWGCTGAAYLNTLNDPTLLTMMRRAGCTVVHFGVESGNADVVKRLRKPFNLDDCLRIVNVVRMAGIKAAGYFMFGFPDETLGQMRDTIDFAMSVPFDRRSFCICLPLPGTTSYRAVLERENIERIDWRTYDFRNPRLLPCEATAAETRFILLTAKLLAKSALARRVHRMLPG